MDISILGINIKRIREEKKVSAYKLSKLANVGSSTISQIETGNRQSLNSSTVEKIASSLGVTTDALYATENDVEYVVDDIDQTIKLFLSSDVLTLDDTNMTTKEREEFRIGSKALLDIIRLQRK